MISSEIKIVNTFYDYFVDFFLECKFDLRQNNDYLLQVLSISCGII